MKKSKALATVPAKGRFTVKLCSVGNPDFQQYAPISNPETVIVDTLEEAAQECRRYIEHWDLGGGNWPRTCICKDGKEIAVVSYNGRLWNPANERESLALPG